MISSNETNIKKEKWIVDADPGCDDMMALLYLLKRPDVDLLMISLVDGNVPLDLVSINSRKIIKLAGKKIPLNRGASFPIIKAFPNAESYHYADGLGDIEEIKNYDYNDTEVEQENSIIKLVHYANSFPGEINLLCLGPLTNLATAYMLDPSITTKFKNVYVMGGSTLSKGNTIPTSEFNFAYDFISSKIAICQFKNLIITPWEPTCELFVRDHIIKQFYENIKTKNKVLNENLFFFVSLIIAKFTADKNGTTLCDLYAAITAFEHKAITQYSRIECDVVIDSPGLMGMLYVKNRRLIKEDFTNYLADIKNGKNGVGSHIVIEELDEIKIFEEYEEVFSM